MRSTFSSSLEREKEKSIKPLSTYHKPTRKNILNLRHYLSNEHIFSQSLSNKDILIVNFLITL